MFNNKNIIQFSLVAIIFIALKFLFKSFDNEQLYFLLKPTNSLVEIMNNSHSVFVKEVGFYHEDLKICINKSCSGYNFWLLTFLLTCFLLIKKIGRFFVISLSLVLSYFFTIFVNASRIFASILLQKKTNFLQFIDSKILHESIGVFVNLFFLILMYLLLENILSKKLSYEKST